MPVARSATVALSPAGGSPPAGYFVSTTGSATGAGTYADPWTLKQAFLGGFPTTTLQPGDTVWIRGGTYTAPDSSGAGGDGHWKCELDGEDGNPIVFRGYPGERAILDGNYDPAETGNSNPTVFLRWNNLTNHGRYIWLRDVEITNSNTDIMHVAHFEPEVRGDAVDISAPGAKLINCVLHDSGQGYFAATTARDAEVYGCLIYYNGFYAPYTEQNSAVSVDLPDTGGVAPTLSGSYTMGSATTTPLTFDHTNAAGNYTLVVVTVFDQTGHYTDLTATYGGDSMTCINGINGHELDDGYTGWGPVAMFGITGHTGTNSVSISYAGGSNKAIYAMAQSFAGVGAGVAAGGAWSAHRYDPIGGAHTSATTTSDTNHLVVDGIGIYNTYCDAKDYAPNADNTGNMVGGAVTGNTPKMRMSWAAGAASVDMGWTWTANAYPHGHGAYCQSGMIATNVATTASDTTITSASNPWVASDVGKVIDVRGTETGGHNLVTTIASFNSAGSIELAVAPGATMTGIKVMWGPGHTYKNNIFLQQASLGIQTYGSSDTGFVDSEISGNLFVTSRIVLGGRTGFQVGGTVFTENGSYGAQADIGFEVSHLDNYEFTDNVIDANASITLPATWDDVVITGNTFTGTTTNFDSGDFPTNTYSTPGTNQIIVKGNVYEANRANIYVFNWQNLTTVSVDLSSVVAAGTPIYVMNAQNYYAAPVWTGTYSGGSITLPQAGTLSDLTTATPVGTDFVAITATAPDFACFIVRAQSAETWR